MFFSPQTLLHIWCAFVAPRPRLLVLRKSPLEAMGRRPLSSGQPVASGDGGARGPLHEHSRRPCGLCRRLRPGFTLLKLHPPAPGQGMGFWLVGADPVLVWLDTPPPTVKH